MRFTKMEALGNDFVVLEAIRQPLTLDHERVRQIADRRRGVGCDQVLLAEPASSAEADISYRIFNADGSEVEHCGNGVRCLARYLVDQGLLSGPRVRVETRQGINLVEIEPNGEVNVVMGIPILEPVQIPFQAAERASVYPLETPSGEQQISAVSMGNPHAVLVVDELDRAPVAELGAQIEAHSRFPRRTNVGFMQICRRDRVRLRVFERGVGETPACGTGACAAVVAGRLRGLLDNVVQVELPGGQLVISWDSEGEAVMMSGAARTVFHGAITI